MHPQLTALREQNNGYIQIAPVVLVRTRAGKGEAKKAKPKPQNAHRLVVFAHKSCVYSPTSPPHPRCF
jgi:hypothetical protein